MPPDPDPVPSPQFTLFGMIAERGAGRSKAGQSSSLAAQIAFRFCSVRAKPLA